MSVQQAEPDYGFDKMDDQEFMNSWDDAGDQSAKLRAKIEAFSIEHQRRVGAAQLANQLGPMTEAQKEAAILAIHAMPTAVESEEAVGEPQPPEVVAPPVATEVQEGEQ